MGIWFVPWLGNAIKQNSIHLVLSERLIDTQRKNLKPTSESDPDKQCPPPSPLSPGSKSAPDLAHSFNDSAQCQVYESLSPLHEETRQPLPPRVFIGGDHWEGIKRRERRVTKCFIMEEDATNCMVSGSLANLTTFESQVGVAADFSLKWGRKGERRQGRSALSSRVQAAHPRRSTGDSIGASCCSSTPCAQAQNTYRYLKTGFHRV